MIYLCLFQALQSDMEPIEDIINRQRQANGPDEVEPEVPTRIDGSHDDSGSIVDSSNRNILLKWGSEGSNEGQMNRPAGIDIDSSDDLYVNDAGNNRIQKFDAEGNFISVWASKGSDEGHVMILQWIPLTLCMWQNRVTLEYKSLIAKATI
jgi:hypothetical protein